MILNNVKMEKFCQVYIRYSDESKWRDILKDSGYSIARGRTQFKKLIKRLDVMGRILELQKEAAGKEVLTLHERLKMLSDIAKSNEETARTRIAALSQIHKQSGDDIIKMDVDVDGSSVIRFVDVKLPASPLKEDIEEGLSISEGITVDDLLGKDNINEAILEAAKNINETDDTDFDFEDDDLLGLDD